MQSCAAVGPAASVNPIDSAIARNMRISLPVEARTQPVAEPMSGRKQPFRRDIEARTSRPCEISAGRCRKAGTSLRDLVAGTRQRRASTSCRLCCSSSSAASRFDSVPAVEHPRQVLRLVHRLAALALTFGLMAGNAAICAGWMPTPEARMACCADDADCPMHMGDSHGPGAARPLTQAQADNCCASSESKNSSQSSPTFVAAITAAVIGVGTVLPANVPALVLSDGWRTSAPIPVAPVQKHVLLSVFLV